MSSILQDLRYALRQWRRAPGFATVAIVTLALGIGANTAIFLLTYSILLKSLPVPHPEELVRYTFRKGESEIGLSYPLYQALAKQQSVASGLFAWHGDNATVKRDGQFEKMRVAFASGSVFPVLQLQPVLGRGFEAQPDPSDASFVPEALLSYDYWQGVFHGDVNVLGKTIDVENTDFTIVGVLPQGFEGVQKGQTISVLLPLSSEAVVNSQASMLKQPGAFWLTVMGRLNPGQSVRSAQANLSAIDAAVTHEADPSGMFLNGGFFSTYHLGVESGRSGQSWLRFKYSRPLMALEGLCGLMLLLCAVNVALLVLSRVSTRLHEFAVRNAMGATRARLLSQVVTETLLLGFGGLAAGCWIGIELAKVLIGMISSPGNPPALHLQVGVVVFLFTSAVSLAAAGAAGLWPAWRASKTAPAVDLKVAGARRSSPTGLWLVAAQVALGVLLLNAALLLSGTLLTYLHENSGFHADDVTLAELNLTQQGGSKEKQRVLGAELEFLRRLQAMPGVQSAALMNMAPLRGGFSVGDYYSHDAEGHLRANGQVWPESATVDYFKVMGTRIVAGRTFSTADLSGDHVCVLSAAAASYFFPGSNAIGQSISAGDGTEKPSERESCRVIGVAEDARLASLLDPAPLMVYTQMETQPPETFLYATVAVRAASPALATAAIRRAFAEVFPTTAAPSPWRFQDAVAYDLSRQRLLGSVSGGFAVLALALLATGLYGILMRLVAEQRRDIGIRMALGARRARIISGLAQRAGLRVGAGALAGAGTAALLAHFLRPLLHGVSFGSPAIVFTTAGLLLVVLAMAFIAPALRAVRIAPAEVIREE